MNVTLSVHLFGNEPVGLLWPRINDLIEATGITTCVITSPSRDILFKASEYVHDAIPLLTRNCGRDIHPFLLSLRTERIACSEVVVKIHSKPFTMAAEHRQKHGIEALTWWTDPTNILCVISLFRQNRTLGIVARTDDVISKFGNDAHANSPFLRRFLPHIVGTRGVHPTVDTTGRFHSTFIAGSFFACRPKALRGISQLSSDYFEDNHSGAIGRDGTPVHALERLIPLSVTNLGYDFMSL